MSDELFDEFMEYDSAMGLGVVKCSHCWIEKGNKL